ncbi:hypothetical protein H0H81_009630 [Sphagnurus paluster]|uniref:Uncharacterized protein n=1 Tax=Sphagnurus paluster TaxID=117069 RepID=A0A9P7KL16_9AGAR|nr:hypothetical protein H0H81_009630 [Sphagnurus paluster]
MSKPPSPYTFRLKTPGRNAHSPTPPDNLDAEAVYIASELQRDETFNQFLLKQQHQFTAEQHAQGHGEQERSEVFRTLIVDLSAKFQDTQRNREKSFAEADSRQEEIFSKNESGREALFSKAQDLRTDSFERDRSFRLQHSQACVSAREEIILHGREERKNVCAEVRTEIEDGFKKWMVFEEASFLSAERRRDEFVEKIMVSPAAHIYSTPSRHGSQSAAKDNTSVRGEQESTSDPRLDPENFRVRSLADIAAAPSVHPSRQSVVDSASTLSQPTCPPELDLEDGSWTDASSSESHSGLPATSPIESHKSTLHISSSPPSSAPLDQSSTVCPAVSAQISKRASQATLPAAQSPVPSTSDSTPDSTTTVADNGVQHSMKGSQSTNRTFEERFAQAEEERHNTFVTQQQAREMSFEAGESTRDNAERLRDQVFEQTMSIFVKKFSTLMEAHDNVFLVREHSRQGGALRRHTTFKAWQAQTAQAFHWEIMHVEKQAEARDSLEPHLAEFTERLPITSLVKKLGLLLEKSREDRATRFRQSQFQRDAKLKVTSPPYSRPGICHVLSDAEERFPLSSPALSDFIHLPSTGADTYPFVRAPGAFFHHLNARTALPIPGDFKEDKSKDYDDFDNGQRRRQHAFELAQSQRQSDFDRGVRKRQYAFEIAEARRQAKFEAKQQYRWEAFAEESGDFEKHFDNSQKVRETQFRNAEQAREIRLHMAEDKRRKLFEAEQERRNDRFYKVQAMLQRKCYQAELRRLSKLRSWGQGVKYSEQRDCTLRYEEEEAARENAFQKSLDLWTQGRMEVG